METLLEFGKLLLGGIITVSILLFMERHRNVVKDRRYRQMLHETVYAIYLKISSMEYKYDLEKDDLELIIPKTIITFNSELYRLDMLLKNDLFTTIIYYDAVIELREYTDELNNELHNLKLQLSEDSQKAYSKMEYLLAKVFNDFESRPFPTNSLSRIFVILLVEQSPHTSPLLVDRFSKYNVGTKEGRLKEMSEIIRKRKMNQFNKL